MSLLTALRPGVRAADLAAAVSLAPPVIPLQLVSPLAKDGSLAKVIFDDIFGADSAMPLTRAQAMAIPAAARARHILCGMIATQPLRSYRGDQLIAPAPWIGSMAGVVSPWHRMAWTVDDLLWYGWSAWRRTNGADGYPLRMDRIAMGSWSVEPYTGRVLVDRGDGIHEPVRLDSVVLIPGPHEGLLVFAQDTLRHASDLQTAAAQAARTPAAHLVLHQVAGDPLPLDPDPARPNAPSINGLIAQWAAARRGANAGVAFLPQTLKAEELGTFSEHLLVEGRNTAAIDIARQASLPADLIDADAKGSLTYATSQDNDRRAVDYGAGLYLGAIQGALSMDGVTPLGQRVGFDLAAWLASNVPGQDPAITPGPAAPTPPAAPAPAPQEVPA